MITPHIQIPTLHTSIGTLNPSSHIALTNPLFIYPKPQNPSNNNSSHGIIKLKEAKEEGTYGECSFWWQEIQDCLFMIRARKILPELIFQINANESPQIWRKIEQRGWQLLTSPEGKINGNLIKEFYANAVREDKTKAPTFKSYVRGREVDFNPSAITRALHL